MAVSYTHLKVPSEQRAIAFQRYRWQPFQVPVSYTHLDVYKRQISSGELMIGDKVVNDVEPKDRDIAMVFQNYALYPHMTVYDNMAFGLKLRKVPKDEIDKMVKEAARILDPVSYTHLDVYKRQHLICVLKGGVFFMCELAKRISVPVSMDFMSVSSYGDGTSSSGVVKIAKDLDETLEGKDVLVVEDIIDSGRTLYYLLEILKKRNPNLSLIHIWSRFS